MTELNKSIGFIGAGNMAEAIAGALLKSESIQKSMISLCDTSIDRLAYMSTTYGISGTSEIEEVYNSSDVIILAVKPQSMNNVLEDIAKCKRAETKKKLIISIAAGVTINRFETYLYTDKSETFCMNTPVIRVMPNTPSLVLSGMSGMCKNKYADSDDIQTATTILSSMGKVIEIDESKMDAVTAVSGSGPAYFFYFVESMIEEAENLGLTSEEAYTLAVTTMKGAADLLESSEDSPAVLRRKVTSPGGTTEAAIKTMDEAKTKEIIQKAVRAAADRSKELS